MPSPPVSTPVDNPFEDPFDDSFGSVAETASPEGTNLTRLQRQNSTLTTLRRKMRKLEEEVKMVELTLRLLEHTQTAQTPVAAPQNASTSSLFVKTQDATSERMERRILLVAVVVLWGCMGLKYVFA